MTAVRSGLSSDAVRELSDVLEAGPFVNLAITDDRLVTSTGFGLKAQSCARVASRSTVIQLVRAMRCDEVVDP